jgi:hypothetical protein
VHTQCGRCPATQGRTLHNDHMPCTMLERGGSRLSAISPRSRRLTCRHHEERSTHGARDHPFTNPSHATRINGHSNGMPRSHQVCEAGIFLARATLLDYATRKTLCQPERARNLGFDLSTLLCHTAWISHWPSPSSGGRVPSEDVPWQ